MTIDRLGFSALALLVSLACGAQDRGALAEPVHATEAVLEAARAELLAREAAYARMRARYDTEIEADRLTREERIDFRAFLDRLLRLVDEQRRTLARLEGAPAGGGAGDARPGEERLGEGFSPGRTEAEKISSLDRELGASLSEFDEMLLREQQELAEKARPADAGAAGEGTGEAGEARRAGEGSGDGGEAGEPGEGETAGGPADGAAGDSRRAGAERGGTREGSEAADAESEGQARDGRRIADASGAEDRDGGVGGRDAAPGDVPDAGDDDVVARQLREAAESEQDPELREKLWEEYRRYKSRGQ